MAASLSGAWVVTPTVRADVALGWGREQPERERWRNDSRWLRLGASVILPRGFTVGGSGELRLTEYEGKLVSVHDQRRAPGGQNPFLTGLRAQPGLRVEGLQPATLAGARGADDQCTALRLQAHRRRIALRAPFLTPQGDHVPASSLLSCLQPRRTACACANGGPHRRSHGKRPGAPPCPTEACARPGPGRRGLGLVCALAFPVLWPGAGCHRRAGLG